MEQTLPVSSVREAAGTIAFGENQGNGAVHAENPSASVAGKTLDPQERAAVTRLVSKAFQSGRQYLEAQGYTEVVTPRIVRASGACENIDTLYQVMVDGDQRWYNGHQAYLAQTGQLYLESLVPSIGKVYCSGPSFRAEAEVDDRHLSEFQMMEIEFPGTFDMLLFEIESFIYHIAQDVAKLDEPAHVGLTLETQKRLASCPSQFTRITYDEAIVLLQKMGVAIQWGDDIHSAQEQQLVEKFGNQPIFITRYPDPMWDHGKEIEVEKFFNMLPDPENPGRVLSCDTILPIAGEAVGSAARVHDVDRMIARLQNSRMFKRLLAKGGSLDDFSWYIERLRTEGSVPHAGCGFGMSRITKWIRGCDSIMQAVTFPANREALI